MNKYILGLLLVFVNLSLFSQEILINKGNPFLKQFSEQQYNEKGLSLKSTMEIDTLELPFFDDFANSSVYPDSSKWIDKFAFINNDYAIDPISIGVASLDAIDQNGGVYSHLPFVGSAIADYLTSQPINLELSPSDSIYLSFYYQAGGKGNMPDYQDSLVLQFCTPDIEWRSIWNVAGGDSMENFVLVHLPITDEAFLKKGFQFRFLNYASVSSNYEPSWKSNVDVWNIDYVKLNKNRSWSDTLANDVAFLYDFKSIIKDFESVPWKHFINYTGEDLIIDSLSFVYKNSWSTEQNINRVFAITNSYTQDTICVPSEVGGDSENISGLETIIYDKLIDCSLYSSFAEDSAKFTIIGNISTDTIASRHMYRWNDTIKYSQDFFNYYAYDDGTAEVGYGIIGSYASLAYKFTPLIADTLKGVFIYFNQVMEEANRKNFYLTIWADNNGLPGEIIKEMEGVIPVYSDEVNKYVFYQLDTPVYIESTFYVGWVKTTNDVLNCGFDMNRNAKDRLFYNVTGQWVPSQYDGALMVRPVFGYCPHPGCVYVDDTDTKKNSEFKIYPNPVSDVLNISSDQEYEYFEIYDTSGKLLLTGKYTQNINMSGLQNGIYFIQLKSGSKIYKPKKFIILR